MARAPRRRLTTFMTAVVVATLPASCIRTIEEEEPVELIEHRIEPCRSWCEPMLSDCGRAPNDKPFATVDDCVDDCADDEPGANWWWGLQADGTDACAEEWFAVADCMDSLTCEQHLSFFRKTTLEIPPEWPCIDELAAQEHCFYSTPSLDNPDGGR